MNILNHKLGLIFSALVLSLVAGCGTTATVQTAKAPTAHVATEAPAMQIDPTNPTTWISTTVDPVEHKTAEPAPSPAFSQRNTLCAGATVNKGHFCKQAKLYSFIPQNNGTFVASAR